MAAKRRGMIAIFVAKMVFLVSGYALYMSLSRLLTTEEFGVYGVVFGVVSLMNMVLINGTWQTISHFVAANPGSENRIRRRGFRYQLVFVTVVLGLFYLLSPSLGDFLNDPSLSRYFRLSIFITAIYGFYAINIGFLNGSHLFERQASLDIGFACLKVSLIVYLVWKGWGIEGVIYGFTLAAFLILLTSFGVARVKSNQNDASSLTMGQFLRYAASVLGVAMILNLIINSDLFLLKKLTDPSDADRFAGYYTAAQSIARIPYYLLISASIIVFPMLAKLKGTDEESKRRQAETSSKALIMILGVLAGMLFLCIPISDRIVLVLYPARLEPASLSFPFLLAGMVFLTLLNLATSMISGGGKPLVSAFLLGICFLCQVASALLLIPKMGMVGAGASTLIGSLVSFALAYLWLFRHFRTRLPVADLLWIILGSIGCYLLSMSFDAWNPIESRIITVLFLGLSFGIYSLFLLWKNVIILRPSSS